MPNFQARIKPEWRHRFPHLKTGLWYDVEPLWEGTQTRRVDMADKRVARLKTGTCFTSLRADYLVFRPNLAATHPGTPAA